MKKVALVFVLAVLLPSLVLAWLAVRSLRDQQFLLERQQSLLYQRVTDSLAQNISDYLTQRQQEFSAQVESLAANRDAYTVAGQFDDEIRERWPLAEVGFCVTLSGKILSPAPNARPDAQMFRLDNSGFLGNREVAEVYLNSTKNNTQNFARAGQSQKFAVSDFSNGSFGGMGGGGGGGGGGSGESFQKLSPSALDSSASAAPSSQGRMMAGNAAEKIDGIQLNQPRTMPASGTMNGLMGTSTPSSNASAPAASTAFALEDVQPQTTLNYKMAETRKVSPQNAAYDTLKDSAGAAQNNLSKAVPAEAEFAQLIGDETDGMLARFLQNKLKLMFWHRLNREPGLIFGAQLDLHRLVDGLRSLVQPEPALRDEICLVLLDDNAKPVALSRAGFLANWKRPFVATEIGDALPHWEIAAYLVNPTALTQAACTAEIMLALLVAVLVLAIGIGSLLIVSNLNAELKLSRQKTDFVSNVSHELKTPLTSIRMFSELLAEGRVTEPARQQSYLNIISAEAARLTRLINNVLDFSRMENGEKKYNFQPCDLTDVVRSTAGTFRPHLEANGFQFDCQLPEAALSVRGDADALSQIVVNLLSNAEKYSNGQKEITLQLILNQSPLPHAEVRVLDRGSGVPPGSGEKIFEKFYRAHDSLASGIQGSGLGLTIARQIARAHGGELAYEPRAGGGSCFILRLPVSTTEKPA